MTCSIALIANFEFTYFNEGMEQIGIAPVPPADASFSGNTYTASWTGGNMAVTFNAARTAVTSFSGQHNDGLLTDPSE